MSHFSRLKGGRPDKDFKKSYRKELVGQFEALNVSKLANNPQALAVALKITAMAEEETSWEDLYCLELAVIALEPDAELQRHAWSLRSEYKEIASAEEWSQYVTSDPPGLNPNSGAAVKPDELRNDLLRLQKEIHWRYTILWAFEDYRSHITFGLTVWSAGALASLLLLQAGLADRACAEWNLNLPLVALAAGLGILGGFTSTIRRIQQCEWGGNADVDIAKLGAGNIALFLSPILGGVFSTLLVFMFAAGLVDGDLFPAISFESLQCANGPDLEGADYAKLIVWAFTAGFAEQLVPDNLARLTGK